MGSPSYDRAWGAFVNSVTRAHRVVHRATGGRVEIRLPKGGRGVWITTLGRRSGQWRRTPLLAIQDAQEPGVWIIAGSNGGQERLPGWVFNVQSHAEGTLEVARQTWPVRFVEVHGAERERCYAQLASTWPMYRSYERHAGRPIPVFRCRPIAADAAKAPDPADPVR
ncbi:MAG: nitroreductase family deazaflavin-dependent oxidoreductase [Actinomycetales bacterium]|nr:nitroreductase family deazaflavin-dependent oxidoreductase [Actinomycetales bacterium]